MSQVSKEHIILTTILSCLVTMESMEQLQGLEAYRHEIKQSGNRFFKELSKYTSELVPLIWGIEEGKYDETMYMLMDYQQKVIAKLASMRPEDIGIVLAMISKYQEHPRKTLNRLEIKVIDSSAMAAENEN
ncbi:MAG: hypothetical protein EOP49_34110 [Sphingobacteriales bacterium]|nr:MAG: hypothetical protein EOP49_34110 [Sphingobacteriales bacterium]